jgi:hypothetical protein
MSRLRKNFITGTISSALTSSGTTMSLTAKLGDFNVTAPDYLPLVINPNSAGVSNTSEIVYVTAYTAASLSATITRGNESSTAAGWSSGTVYSHGVLAADLPTDLPAPSASGQILTSTSTTSGTWSSTINSSTIYSSTFNGGAVNNAAISGGSANTVAISNSSISSSTIYSGNIFNAGSVPTSSLTGSLNATTVTGVLSTSTTTSNAWNSTASSTTVSLTVSGYNTYLLSCNRTYYSSSSNDQITQTLKIGASTVATAAARITPTSTGPDVVSLNCTFAYNAPSTAAFTVSYTYTGGTGVALSNGNLNIIGFN